MTAVEVVHIAKSFGRRQVLRDVSFRARPGELVGIQGENGCGKSTLLKILVGLLAPSAGRVARSGRVGYCPQEPQLFEALTVRENFTLFAAAYGLNDVRAGAERSFLLEELRFTKYLDFRAADLSGGTKQKLNLSIAILDSPDIVVLDEPYNGFDRDTYSCFWNWAARQRAAGRCIIIVSHMLHDREKFDHLYELKEGVATCA